MEASLQDRIEAIYSYDSPGLNHSVTESDGYQAMVERMKRYLPQNSIVGMMLETPKEARMSKAVPSAALPSTIPFHGKSRETLSYCWIH